MVVEITDEISSKLGAIRITAPELAREQMSKIGNDVKKSMQANMLRRRHSMFSSISTREEKVDLYRDNSRSKRLGLSMDSAHDMSKMITSYLDEKNGLLIVGGRHKDFIPLDRKDGEVVGTRRKVDGIGKRTMAIIDKLDTGEVGDDYGQYINGRHVEDPFREGQTFRAYGFKKAGIKNTADKVNRRITSEYEKLYTNIEQNMKNEPRRSRHVS